jgi:ubiquitin carboxyl-terminal hydrolase 25/28
MGLLQKQNSGMEIEQDPTIFPDIRNQINPQFIQLLEHIKKQTEGRILTFKDKRQHLEKLIEQSYRCIMTTEPYILQSILIHEGQAESGHYYSYSYDT